MAGKQIAAHRDKTLTTHRSSAAGTKYPRKKVQYLIYMGETIVYTITTKYLWPVAFYFFSSSCVCAWIADCATVMTAAAVMMVRC